MLFAAGGCVDDGRLAVDASVRGELAVVRRTSRRRFFPASCALGARPDGGFLTPVCALAFAPGFTSFPLPGDASCRYRPPGLSLPAPLLFLFLSGSCSGSSCNSYRRW